ncbi:MAG: 16S rRNA (adenine(1518)-N(6)/adenine(1519)-N(6))-dimethyltransferase RsmA [Chloroflexi bacterium]|nr:16S rRNA (adenine(1518)-N(6)/adenine(1519)-N(6))-dimethyltransferase RsmA [Chloroflexota bacterium]
MRGPLGLPVRKSLGQHFLVDRRVLRRVVSAAELTPHDTVIEVGPGLGVLTRELAQCAGQVIAVEADPRLASALSGVMAAVPNVRIVQADILQTDTALLLSSAPCQCDPPSFKVVANIPYYITSPILRHFLEATPRPSVVVVMVQKEVGEAITAQPGDMSLLSIGVQFYGKPIIVGQVPPRSFSPPPKVQSVILRIDLYDKRPVEASQAASLFAAARAGFSAPRKQLRNSLAQGLGVSPQEAAAILESAAIDPRRRAQTVTLEEWARVSEEIGAHAAEVAC